MRFARGGSALKEKWAMFDDLGRYPQVIAPFHYTDDAMLLGGLESDVVELAEQRARELAGKSPRNLFSPGSGLRAV